MAEKAMVYSISIQMENKMTNTLTIKSVKCIKPSSGIDSVDQSLFQMIEKTSVADAIFSDRAITGGLNKALTRNMAADITGRLDHFFAGYEDELYIKVNDSKIWPAGKHEQINSQQTKEVEYSLPLDKSVTIQLWEYDQISSDDLLGYLTLRPNHQQGDFTYLVCSREEGSIYEIRLLIS